MSKALRKAANSQQESFELNEAHIYPSLSTADTGFMSVNGGIYATNATNGNPPPANFSISRSTAGRGVINLANNVFQTLPTAVARGDIFVDGNGVMWATVAANASGGFAWSQLTIPVTTYANRFTFYLVNGQLHDFSDKPGTRYKYNSSATRWESFQDFVANFNPRQVGNPLPQGNHYYDSTPLQDNISIVQWGVTLYFVTAQNASNNYSLILANTSVNLETLNSSGAPVGWLRFNSASVLSSNSAALAANILVNAGNPGQLYVAAPFVRYKLIA